jgi:hypothetical protein
MITRSTWWWRTTKQTRVNYLASAHIKRDKIFVSEHTTNVRDDTVCATTVRVPRSKDTRINRWLQHEFIPLQPRMILIRLPWTRACQATILEWIVPRKTYHEQLYKSCARTKQQTRVTNPERVHSKRDKILVSEQTNNVRDETMCTTTACAPRNKDTRIPRGLQNVCDSLQHWFVSCVVHEHVHIKLNN